LKLQALYSNSGMAKPFRCLVYQKYFLLSTSWLPYVLLASCTYYSSETHGFPTSFALPSLTGNSHSPTPSRKWCRIEDIMRVIKKNLFLGFLVCYLLPAPFAEFFKLYFSFNELFVFPAPVIDAFTILTS